MRFAQQRVIIDMKRRVGKLSFIDGDEPMASDQDMADDIRTKVQKLRDSIVSARNAGLIVEIPLLLVHWLENGNAPGEPAVWTIKRKSL